MSIQIEQLSKSFGNTKVIEKLNLHIPEGSFVSIVGPSGCGKSTLLRLIAGLDEPSAGFIQNTFTSPSYVFQSSNLLPWRTTLENVLLPPQLKKLPKEKSLEQAKATLQKVGLGGFEKHFPHELSGGMQMRTSLARALVTTPDILLMDEPFSALDEVTRYEMQNQLLDLWRETKTTIIFVTHSLAEAAYLSENILMMPSRGGGIRSSHVIQYSAERNELLRTSIEFNEMVRALSKEFRQ